MNPILRHLFYLMVILQLPAACYGGNTSGLIARDEIWDDSQRTLKIWALSDIQPRNNEDKQVFKNAITDVNNHIPGIDMVIVAGDIANKGKSETYDWYLSNREFSYIKDWNEIAGNHDLKTDLGKFFLEDIKPNFNYSLAKGNILFIFMSDEQRGKPTEISDETFNWWKDLVINNQDKIIVVVTHAPLDGSGIPFSGLRDRQIIDSGRFTEVLKKYKVDLWLSGHLHLPHYLANTVQKEEYNGTIFVSISSIRPEFFKIKNSESRVITFLCDWNYVLIQARDHYKKTFDENLSSVYQLSKKYKCEK
jgi:3',5'-cyclic AMP phosphodiesterase CpdA